LGIVHDEEDGDVFEWELTEEHADAHVQKLSD
jgi:hypothetical protein